MNKKKLNTSQLFRKKIFEDTINFTNSVHIIREENSDYVPAEKIYLKDSRNLFLRDSNGLRLVVRRG